MTDIELGSSVLTIAVLVILITAPIGAVAVMTAGTSTISYLNDFSVSDPDPGGSGTFSEQGSGSGIVSRGRIRICIEKSRIRNTE